LKKSDTDAFYPIIEVLNKQNLKKYLYIELYLCRYINYFKFIFEWNNKQIKRIERSFYL